MKFSVNSILESIPKNQSLEVKKLERMMKLTKKSERQLLTHAIEGLSAIGIIHLNEDGDVSRSDDPTFIEARLRCSSKGYCFAMREDGEDDIYIRDHNLNHSLNGDKVLVKVTREGVRRRSPEGAVQCILERSRTNFLANIQKQGDQLIAVPLDDRVLTTVNLPEKDNIYYSQEHEKSIYEVKIDKFPIAQYSAEGHVQRKLQLDGKPENDLDLILTKSDLHELPREPKVSIKEAKAKSRLDLTDQPTMLLTSWTGPNAPQLPAINVLPHQGGVRIWIHAIDVASRFTLSSNLDLWMRNRCEAHCLGSKWINLLTETLFEAVSFSIDKTSDAISLSLDINNNGEVSDWCFQYSKIKPKALITNDHLLSLAKRKPTSKTVPVKLKGIKDYISQLQTLLFASDTIYKNEIDSNSIPLNVNSATTNNLGDLDYEDPSTTLYKWIQPLNSLDANSLLAPILRTAHRIWFQHSKSLKIPTYCYNKNDIDENTFNELVKSTVSLNLPLVLNDKGNITPHELSHAINQSPHRRILEKQFVHCFKDSQLYIHKPTSHDKTSSDSPSLLANSYNDSHAPWTSPSQHYSDILNQFLINMLLTEGKSSSTTRSKSKIELGSMLKSNDINWDIFSKQSYETLEKITHHSILKHVNNKRRQARSLRKDIISFNQSRSAEKLIGLPSSGFITGVQSYGFFVELVDSSVEGLVHVSSLNDDWYEYRSRQNKLVGRKSKKSYQLGDKVQLKVVKVDLIRSQVDLELLEPGELTEVTSQRTENLS